MVEEQIRAYLKAKELFCFLQEQKAEAAYLKSRKLSLAGSCGRRPGDPTAKVAINMLELDEKLNRVGTDMLEMKKQLED